MKAINAAYNILSNNSALTAVVGSRINPLRLPQGSSFPAITLHVISNVPHMSKSGPSKTDFARVQVDVFGTTYQSAYRVAELVRSAMEVPTPGIFNGVTVQVIEYDGEIEMNEDQAAFAGVYHVSQDYIINYSRIESATGDNFMLLESGDFMLLESGSRIIL